MLFIFLLLHTLVSPGLQARNNEKIFEPDPVTVAQVQSTIIFYDPNITITKELDDISLYIYKAHAFK